MCKATDACEYKRDIECEVLGQLRCGLAVAAGTAGAASLAVENGCDNLGKGLSTSWRPAAPPGAECRQPWGRGNPGAARGLCSSDNGSDGDDAGRGRCLVGEARQANDLL